MLVHGAHRGAWEKGRRPIVLEREVFALSFPDGSSWAEYAFENEDRAEVLMDLLRFLDAYASPDTCEGHPSAHAPGRKGGEEVLRRGHLHGGLVATRLLSTS